MTAIIDGTGSIGAALGPFLCGRLSGNGKLLQIFLKIFLQIFLKIFLKIFLQLLTNIPTNISSAEDFLKVVSSYKD